METNIIYAMSSFLTYRTIVKENISFSNKYPPRYFKPYKMNERISVTNSKQTLALIKEYLETLFSNDNNNVALMLSGGIDSAILAALVPEGTQAYTFKTETSVSVDDVIYAKKYAQKFNLKHTIIDVDWDDYNQSIDDLMTQKGSPIHSIEPQIFKAAKIAKKDGFTHLLFGENADIVFGGFNGLLSKDWNVDEFFDRYCFVDPRKVLKDYEYLIDPIKKYASNDIVDVHAFINDVFYKESNSSYENACSLAEINFCTPFSQMKVENLDLAKIRDGQNKYILREIFASLYPEFENRKKVPMPRAVDKWFGNWEGPKHEAFKRNIKMENLSGDQKWMIYVLERYLLLIGE
ncbi:asparagine synthase C-terminal domain-containing protein [Enterococcus casseliflavus]|uniref:asparagine synthase C-terminal domain-containing protein n=1 Tax=Enterococcus casseliflavus TaxID=37734 RepID=UPI002953C290|nr:asparagine synthase C-terminal domain-containing protein [Enterococcus casseliflavus]MDV7751299.1 asparagine synthase C-terminal domain-containing protein [Enterococcus casseliflavus]